MESSALFIIAAFCLGGVLILMKDNIAPVMKKWLAIIAIVFILFAFFLIVHAVLTLGT